MSDLIDRRCFTARRSPLVLYYLVGLLLQCSACAIFAQRHVFVWLSLVFLLLSCYLYSLCYVVFLHSLIDLFICSNVFVEELSDASPACCRQFRGRCLLSLDAGVNRPGCPMKSMFL